MGLNRVREIERAIRALKPQELEELYSWLDQNCPQPIDTRVQADLAAVSTTPFNALWTTKRTVASSRFSTGCGHRATAEFCRAYRALPPEIRIGPKFLVAQS